FPGDSGGLYRLLNRRLALLALIALGLSALLALGLAVPGVAAQTDNDAEPCTVQLPPSATVKLTVYGHCMNYSIPFPGPTLEPVDLAPPEVRVAIAHSVGQGYLPSNRWDVQL